LEFNYIDKKGEEDNADVEIRGRLWVAASWAWNPKK